MNGEYKIGEVVLEKWKLIRLIGAGSFGKVFEAEREDFGQIYKAAIKIITIPQSDGELKSVQADSVDGESVSTYFRGIVEELVTEFALMSKLKGQSNVVSYEDHTVIAHEDNIGWDIIIRMELLTPLLDYMKTTTMTQQDAVKLGIDMCKALELCKKHHIIHRDIKPENIFVSENGDFKLGDFGVARTVEKTFGGMSKKGTYTYMAPEVYKEEPYGASVDIYSLGIVLYWLLNERRAPFWPLTSAIPSHAERMEALRCRMSGEPVIAPQCADNRLSGIVLKACAFEPVERYSEPAQMRQELETVLHNREEALHVPQDRAEILKAPHVDADYQDTETQTECAFGRIKGSDVSTDFGEEPTESAFRGNWQPVAKTNEIEDVAKQGVRKKLDIKRVAMIALCVLFWPYYLMFLAGRWIYRKIHAKKRTA